jgi:hypothetical protein
MSDAIEHVNGLIEADTGRRAYQPVYIPEGDCVTFYMDDTPCHAVRLNELATVYVSDSEPDRLVGCQIKDVRRRLENYGPFSLSITRGGAVQLGMLFMTTGLMPDRSHLTRGFFESPMATTEVAIPNLCAN